MKRTSELILLFAFYFQHEKKCRTFTFEARMFTHWHIIINCFVCIIFNECNDFTRLIAHSIPTKDNGESLEATLVVKKS
jgi:hypothetical protein